MGRKTERQEAQSDDFSFLGDDPACARRTGEMLVDAMNETLFESCEKSGLDQAERTALLHGAAHYPKQLPTLKRR